MKRVEQVQSSGHVLYAAAVLFSALATPLPAQQRKVLIVGLDGIRGDTFHAMLNHSTINLPNLRSLFENGNGLYSHQATTSDITGSWGGWSDVLRGVYRDEHDAGYWGMGGVQNISPGPSHPDLVANANIFNRLETYDASLSTASFITWKNLHDSLDSGSSSPAIDRGADSRVFVNYTANGDNAVTTQAVDYLANNDPDVMFFYQADPDIAGHNNGFGPDAISTNVNSFSAGYRNEITETDGNIGQVLAAVNSRPGVISGSEEWLVVVTSDHGGTNGGHSQNRVAERNVPFIVSGINTNVVSQTPESNPLFVKPRNVDIVPTVLDHLGVPTSDQAWNGLRGHIIGVASSSQPTIAINANLVFNGDAEYDRGFNGHDETIKSGGSKSPQRDWPNEGLWWDQAISGWDDWSQTPSRNSMTSFFYDAGEDYAFPTSAGPGATDRGSNFFSAGIDGTSVMTQRIDISSLESTDGLGFEMSAFLGGWENDNDRAEFTTRFLDAAGAEISHATITGLDAAGRSGQTGLFHQTLSGAMPANVDSIEFLLSTDGNDAYADNLSFIVTDTISITGDFDSDGDIDAADWLLFAVGLGANSPGSTDLTGDGVSNFADFQRFKELFENFNGAGSFETLRGVVPEPSTMPLLVLGITILNTRRNGQRNPLAA